jgi:hypothetical protein
LESAADKNIVVCINNSWTFYQDAAGLWHWKCVEADGARIVSSPEAFETREKCVQHAARNGWLGFEDREDPGRFSDAPRPARIEPEEAPQASLGTGERSDPTPDAQRLTFRAS